MKVAESKHKQLVKIRPATKYITVYRELLKTFKEARRKGFQVDFNWIWSKARVIYQNQIDDQDAQLKQHVVTSFLKRFNIRMRAKQRNRKMTKESFRQALLKWHLDVRERLIRTGTSF